MFANAAGSVGIGQTGTGQVGAGNAPAASRRRASAHSEMRTTWFDSVSSFLIALLVLVATTVAVLFLLWVFRSEAETKVDPVPPARWVTGGSMAGAISDFAVPVDEEVAELEELPVELSLDQIAVSATEVAASTSSANGQNGETDQMGEGGRSAGPDSDSSLLVSPAERWQLVFAANDIADYALKLDHFAIELGVVGGGRPGVDYAYELSRAEGPRQRHLAASSAEKRIYFRYTDSSPLKHWNRQLVRQAGIELTSERVEMMFIPEDLERQLLAIELAYAKSQGHETLQSVRRTVFSLDRSAGDLVWQVTSQRYRASE
ncbi:hypothetical protein [Novipirellula caenicola]|uniref:Transmembrane protein n=1 Tax=Novipirellula caenicola TaxID=1536901 RepID=A0ABP9VME3_9BACT